MSALQSVLKGLQPKERLAYDQAVVKMWNEFEEMVFNLSEVSQNETIESIKRMSLGQRLKFQQLITKKIQRLKPKNGQEL